MLGGRLSIVVGVNWFRGEMQFRNGPGPTDVTAAKWGTPFDIRTYRSTSNDLPWERLEYRSRCRARDLRMRQLIPFRVSEKRHAVRQVTEVILERGKSRTTFPAANYC